MSQSAVRDLAQIIRMSYLRAMGAPQATLDYAEATVNDSERMECWVKIAQDTLDYLNPTETDKPDVALDCERTRTNHR